MTPSSSSYDLVSSVPSAQDYSEFVKRFYQHNGFKNGIVDVASIKAYLTSAKEKVGREAIRKILNGDSKFLALSQSMQAHADVDLVKLELANGADVSALAIKAMTFEQLAEQLDSDQDHLGKNFVHAIRDSRQFEKVRWIFLNAKCGVKTEQIIGDLDELVKENQINREEILHFLDIEVKELSDQKDALIAVQDLLSNKSQIGHSTAQAEEELGIMSPSTVKALLMGGAVGATLTLIGFKLLNTNPVS